MTERMNLSQYRQHVGAYFSTSIGLSMVDYSDQIQEVEQSAKRLAYMTRCPAEDAHEAIAAEARHLFKLAAAIHAEAMLQCQ